MDTAMGLNKAARFYYYPGWHEPSGPLTLGINRQVWESFATSDQRLIEAAAAGEYGVSLAEFNTNNAIALRKLQRDGTVQIIKFDDAILQGLHQISREAVAEAGAGDDLSRRIYASYQDFQELIGGWSGITEGTYLTAR
jgi:TRAP-type mannitol/chloroaromatic compound transport system substrate-binding protein